MTPTAEIIADSVSEFGTRLTSVQAKGWRWTLAEINTHRVFSRSSASSRAVPFDKMVARLLEDDVRPHVWASEQRGMQGGTEIPEAERALADGLWDEARTIAVEKAKELARLGVHKSIVNRMIEPYLAHTMLITSTAWENFFRQRCSPLAQPELRVLAEQIEAALTESQPESLNEGQWHLPYVDHDTWDALVHSGLVDRGGDLRPLMTKISAARAARNSYMTQAGERDLSEDLRLYEGDESRTGLVTAEPPHWAPLEHVATPWAGNRQSDGPWIEIAGKMHRLPVKHLPKIGNFVGWMQLRTKVEFEKGVTTWE